MLSWTGATSGFFLYNLWSISFYLGTIFMIVFIVQTFHWIRLRMFPHNSLSLSVSLSLSLSLCLSLSLHLFTITFNSLSYFVSHNYNSLSLSHFFHLFILAFNSLYFASHNYNSLSLSLSLTHTRTHTHSLSLFLSLSPSLLPHIYFIMIFFMLFYTLFWRESPMLGCEKIQSHYCIHVRINTLGKGMNPLSPSNGLSSTTTVRQQGWPWH